MSSVFPSRDSIDAPPSKASQVPFLKSVSKSVKSKPEIIRKIARTASAKNSLDLNRPSSEQTFPYYSADSGFSDGTEGGFEGAGHKVRRSLHKLNRSGSNISAFTSRGSTIEIPSRSQRGLAGVGRGSSYHARSTSGTSGISAWSSSRESGGTTPVGGGFRHPWAQTPTVQRENSFGAGAHHHSSSYSKSSISGFGVGLGGGSGSDEDLRAETERDRDFVGRRSLQLGPGYGLGLDGVEEGFERYERPSFVRSSTSTTIKSGVSTRASYREGETRSYTPISQLPPPLAGSRGMGLRVDTVVSGVGVAGVAGRSAGLNSGQVTPVNGSSSRVNLGGSTGSLNGGSASATDINGAAAALNPPTHNHSPASSSRQNLNPHNSNSANHHSSSTNESTVYNAVTGSNPNLNFSSGLINSTSHIATERGGATTSHSPHPDTTTSPISTSTTLPRTSTSGRTRPSLDMHNRLRGLSEPLKSNKMDKPDAPRSAAEARAQWDARERIKAESIREKEAKKMEKMMEKRERGRTSTTSIGTFTLPGGLGGLGGRGRSDTGATGATAGTQETYSTAMGSVISGGRRHTRGGSGATAPHGVGAASAATSYQHGYNNSYDVDDPTNTQAPAFLDTGDAYAPTEAELAAYAAGSTGGRSRRGTDVRQQSPRVKEVREKIYKAKSRSHSAWASFMLWLKTRVLKMQRNSKKIVKGKKKAQ